MKTTLTQIYAMAWKEWREARWYAWAGFILLLVVPAIFTGSDYSRWAAAGPQVKWITYPQFAGMIFALGAAFAAITAIGIASRDLREGMIAPWRQTPIRPWLFMAVKFLTGLGIVLGLIFTASLLHLIMANYVGLDFGSGPMRHNYAIKGVLHLLSSYLFVLLAVYAICFAIVALFRPVLSALLVCAIAIGLLHFLPVFWSALSFLNTFELANKPVMWIFESREQFRYLSDESVGSVHLLGYGFVFPKMLLTYVLSMIVMGGLATLSGMVIAVRGWRLELNVMRVGWTLVVVFLGLFSIAAMQVGNNLEPVMVLPVTLDKTRRVEELHVRGDQMLLGLVKVNPKREWESKASTQLLRANLSQPSTLLLSDHSSSLQRSIHSQNDNLLAWSPDRPQIVFYLDQRYKLVNEQKEIPTRLDLVAMELPLEGTARELARLDLFTWFEKELKNQQTSRLGLHLQQDRLFIGGIRYRSNQLLIFDVSDPARLRYERQVTDSQLNMYSFSGEENRGQVTIQLPKLAGFSARERFDLFRGLGQGWMLFSTEGDTIAQWVQHNGDGLQVYRCVKKDEQAWTYDRVGQRQASALEKVFTGSVIDAVLQDGTLYLLMGGQFSGLMVFDLRDPANPRKLGHYYAHGERFRCLAATGDGRVIAAGYALHVFDLRDRARSVR